MVQTNYFDEPLRVEAEAPGRRGRKKRETAHRIFRSAIELMQRDGFNGVSIEQICERADVARATFFQHFSSKAALMGVFSDIVRQRIEDELAEAELAPIDQLRLIVDHLQRLTDELGPVAPDMLSAFVAEPHGGFRVADPQTGLAQLIVEIVRQGQAEGVFAAHWSAQDVATSLVSAWVSVAARHLTEKPACGRGRLHGVLDIILNGVMAR